jgi:hypothetical protein
MINQALNIKGSLTLTLKKANGDVQVVRKDNIIVNGGFDFICDAIGNAASRPACMGYIALGTGTTSPVATQTALVSELASTGRKTAAYTHTAGTKVMTFTTTFNPGEATGAITEAGVFNAASAGTMFDRVLFNVVNKGADDTITVTFQFTLS